MAKKSVTPQIQEIYNRRLRRKIKFQLASGNNSDDTNSEWWCPQIRFYRLPEYGQLCFPGNSGQQGRPLFFAGFPKSGNPDCYNPASL